MIKIGDKIKVSFMEGTHLTEVVSGKENHGCSGCFYLHKEEGCLLADNGCPASPENNLVLNCIGDVFNKSKLLSCPFCGEKLEVEFSLSDSEHYYFVNHFCSDGVMVDAASESLDGLFNKLNKRS